jgi:uncharacterized integral membrane protein
MIDALQPDFASLKEASHIRETCEQKETRLKKMKNLWTGLFIINLFVFIFFRFIMPIIAFIPEKWRLLAFDYPFITWFLVASVIYLLILIIYFAVSFSSAKSKTEKARQSEWNLLLKVNRKLTTGNIF